MVEGLLTNIGGLLTLISSVPNIIVGKTAGIEFVDFFIKAAPYVVIATVITIWFGSKLFKIRALKTDEERASAKELVAGFDENEGSSLPGFFRFRRNDDLRIHRNGRHDFSVARDQRVGFGFRGFGLRRRHARAIRRSPIGFTKRSDWDLAFFLRVFFAVINAMEHAQVLALIGEWLMADPRVGGHGWTGFFVRGFVPPQVR